MCLVLFLFTSSFEKSLCRVLRLFGSLLGCVQSAESWFSLPRFLFLAFLFGSFLRVSLFMAPFVLVRANHVSCP